MAGQTGSFRPGHPSRHFFSLSISRLLARHDAYNRTLFQITSEVADHNQPPVHAMQAQGQAWLQVRATFMLAMFLAPLLTPIIFQSFDG